MTHRKWITAFIASFVPLGIWLIVWLFRLVTTGGAGGPSLAFIIPTALYLCLMIWLAFRAFTS